MEVTLLKWVRVLKGNERPYRLARSRTGGSQPSDTGSNPVGATILLRQAAFALGFVEINSCEARTNELANRRAEQNNIRTVSEPYQNLYKNLKYKMLERRH